MSASILAFLLGVCWAQQLVELPSLLQCLVLALLSLFIGYRRHWPLLALCLGVLWACVFGTWRLSGGLSAAQQGRDVSIQGYVATLPTSEERRLGFDFVVTQAPEGVPDKLRLSWYAPYPALRAGQQWQMNVRLKRPHGRLNPGGFDYEAWLFANGMGATGYVRVWPQPQMIEPSWSLGRVLASARQAIADRLQALVGDSPLLGVIQALTVGCEENINRQQWGVFRQTGTIHLIVISGSHISLIAGLVFAGTRRVWARFGTLHHAPQNVAALTAWWFACVYAGLAGFTVPTQRALVMLTVVMWALALQRHVSAARVLLLALAAVVGFDPLAVLSVGFWLSFLAVALLLYIASGRLGRRTVWREALQAQWVTAVGLAPLLIGFFQQISLISPLANWLAVPLIGIVVVPLCLLLLALSFAAWPLAQWGFSWLDVLLELWYDSLRAMSTWPMATLSLSEPSFFALLLAGVGVLVLFAPRGLPARYLAVFLCMPLLWPVSEKPPPGQFKLTLLDVGQGLATVVQTTRHVLIFDTGARYSEQSDMGEAVLLPYLRQQNLRVVDRLIVSHGDNDHSGGVGSLLAQVPVDEIYSSVATFAAMPQGHSCQAGLRWRWDEVEFVMLSPDAKGYARENDNSCVLKITGAEVSVLMTGDIEQTAERWLVDTYRDELASDVLIAPHHGSKTSSSAPFLAQVAPRLVLIPAGHGNRFGFPHREVLQRYRANHIESWVSGEQGAITLFSQAGELKVERMRQRDKRYWMVDTPESASADEP